MIEKKHLGNNHLFIQKMWIASGIVAFVVIMVVLLKATFNVLLLILAGALIGIFFTGLSGLICRKTKWKQGICLAIAVTGTILFVAALSWIVGSKLQSQVSELGDTLPATIGHAKEQLSRSTIGKKIVEKISSAESVQRAKTVMSTIFKSTFGILGDVYVVLFIGIFFTVSPDIYKKGYD